MLFVTTNVRKLPQTLFHKNVHKLPSFVLNMRGSDNMGWSAHVQLLHSQYV